MATMTIEDYKKQYEAARAAGDAAGMQAANDGANAIRASQGIAPEYATADIASVAAQQSAAASTPQQTAPAGFTGSASGVSTYTTDQQAIKDQMNANSAAWWSADDATKKQLEAQNQQLAAQLGGTVSFDPATGAWSGTAGVQVPQGSDLSAQVEDYSSYLEQMYAAQKAAALAQLQAAYEQNVAAIDRAGEGVSEQYQAARNSTAGASELAKRNFAEYAAANGLNSGTGGQAELARNVTLQNNLNSIDTAEADTVADLELQRSQAEIEYNNAIAQAEAEGNYQLASALYQEKVRVQNALIEAQAQQQQMDLQRYQLAYQAQRDQVSDSQWQQQFDEAIRQNDIATALNLLSQLGTAQGSVADTLGLAQGTQTAAQQQYADSLAQAQQSTLAEYGNAFMQQGLMPSAEMLAAMGITQTDAQAYTAAVRAQQAAAVASSGSSGGSSSGSSSSGSTMTLTTAKQAASAGVFNDEVLAVLRANGYTDDMLEAIYGYTAPASGSSSGSGNGTAYVGAVATARLMQADGATNQQIFDMLEKYSTTQLTDKGLSSILSILGIGGY